ncbi:MAG: hypothetical protein D6754_02245 [Alphaproteobacteria bacterium]|nr:MAG: hypothetical protein D6754_02245 [Alphaproteobacteria bacterium]
MRRARIEAQNEAMLRRQRDFRLAADVVTAALMTFDEVEAIAVIGSVAKPLWKEVPRFREFRSARVKIWHECADLDLAVWLSSLERLGSLRRARDRALRESFEAGVNPGVTGHQLDIFLFEAGTDRHLGRLCRFSTCPKGKPDCAVPGCGDIPFLRQIEGFRPRADLLEPAAQAMLFRRGSGLIRSALELPQPIDHDDLA